VLSAVTALDIVAARAKHARWCNGVRPLLLDAASSSNSSMGDNTPSPLALPGAKHPLLLQPSLPPLPRPPSSDDACYATDFVAPPLFAFAAATASAGSSSESDDEGGAVTVTQQQQGRTAKPLQLAVPASARVVAITGPNTGGKTVMLKTAGLLALMSKAGLFVPCEQQHGADGASSSSSSSGSDSNTQQQPALLWFDQVRAWGCATAPARLCLACAGSWLGGCLRGGRDSAHNRQDMPIHPPSLPHLNQVLADIGDSQSLQQNLSTFSGHIARLKLLLAAAGPDSLVLLDEVGSGTDPLVSELARRVAGRAWSSVDMGPC
jgi:DNA mismatch repair protein MutS2